MFPPHCMAGTPGQERVAATACPVSVVLDVDERLSAPTSPLISRSSNASWMFSADRTPTELFARYARRRARHSSSMAWRPIIASARPWKASCDGMSGRHRRRRRSGHRRRGGSGYPERLCAKRCSADAHRGRLQCVNRTVRNVAGQDYVLPPTGIEYGGRHNGSCMTGIAIGIVWRRHRTGCGGKSRSRPRGGCTER